MRPLRVTVEVNPVRPGRRYRGLHIDGRKVGFIDRSWTAELNGREGWFWFLSPDAMYWFKHAYNIDPPFSFRTLEEWRKWAKEVSR